MDESDALDILTLASLIHRKLVLLCHKSLAFSD